MNRRPQPFRRLNLSVRFRILLSTCLLILVVVTGLVWLFVDSERRSFREITDTLCQMAGEVKQGQADSIRRVRHRQNEQTEDALRAKADGFAALLAKLSPVSLRAYAQQVQQAIQLVDEVTQQVSSSSEELLNQSTLMHRIVSRFVIDPADATRFKGTAGPTDRHAFASLQRSHRTS